MSELELLMVYFLPPILIGAVIGWVIAYFRKDIS